MTEKDLQIVGLPPPPLAPDVGDLQAQASAGQPAAMTELACRQLTRRDAPPDLDAAASWIASAARLNEPRALELSATFAAAGVFGAPDWELALDYLERAACCGSLGAQGQLRALGASDARLALAGPALWRDLRASIDPAAWRADPVRRPICETPRVRLAERFVQPAVCEWLRARACDRMRPALMYNAETKSVQTDPHRTCSDYEFDLLNTDVVLLLVRLRIASLTQLPTIAMEPPRIFHYALGEYIKPHYDRCNDEARGYGAEGGYRGDRIVTFLLYLNDGFVGGELEFPKVGFRCRGEQGDAIYFAHVDAQGRPDPASLHAGREIAAGEKWVLSQWIHDRPFSATAAA